MSLGLLALALSAWPVIDGARQSALADGHAQVCGYMGRWAELSLNVADGLERYAGIFSGSNPPPPAAQQRVVGALVALIDTTDGFSYQTGGSTGDAVWTDMRPLVRDARTLLLPAVQQGREGRLNADQASQTAAGLRRAAAQVRGFVIDGNCADEAE